MTQANETVLFVDDEEHLRLAATQALELEDLRVEAFAEAENKALEGDAEGAGALAIEANRLSPGLVPAAVMVAKNYATNGKAKAATQVLTTAWQQSPHPDLAQQYAAIAPDEDHATRLKRFAKLIKTTAAHPESRMTMAELHLADDDYEQARDRIATLVDDDPTQRSLTIMAAIIRRTGGTDDDVQEWLTKALISPRDPEWICDSCGHAFGHWDAICGHCDGFDTVVWKRPAMTAHNLDPRVAPLLVAPVPSASEGQILFPKTPAD